MALKVIRDMELRAEDLPGLESSIWWLKKVEESIPTSTTYRRVAITLQPPIKVILNFEKKMLIYSLGETPIINSLLLQNAGGNKLLVTHYRTRDLLEGVYSLKGDEMSWKLKQKGKKPIKVKALFVSNPPENVNQQTN
jgi:hypothetical protein